MLGNNLTKPSKSSIDGVDVLVLKPTLLGGIETTVRLISQAQQWALKVVISSSLESQIGLNVLTALAGHVKMATPAGLDTAKWFEGSLLKGDNPIDKGYLKLDNFTLRDEDINYQFTEAILA